jgi:imidazole glycerol-phosphate synthase subunit HisF
MYNRPRVIPVLTILNDGLVKTKRFSKPVYLGDPINATKIFNEKLVDELVVLDISKDRFLRGPNFQLLQEIADEAFMPLAYGGGIRTVEDGLKILQIGFEKLIFNTNIEQNPNVIEELIRLVGGQSIVLSLDYKLQFGQNKFFTNNGTKKSRLMLMDVVLYYEKLGLGELIIQSIDRDGTRKGYDYKMLTYIAEKTSVPIIALGGCSGLSDIKQALTESKVSACAAGHLFVFYGRKNGGLINFPTEKELYFEGIYND